ncbi:hypothetical protein [Robertkochia aurantiaca]|uniref:hypothetical protein n=1 Tax=Robertkochia aurantiaca TaxID=2873700 RepID=UPI001CCC1EA0|nr:hypothetical protein [Robertkochia sp. 3YJGBD-33]
MQKSLLFLLLFGCVLSSCKSYDEAIVPNQLHADDTFVFTEPVYIYDKEWKRKLRRNKYEQTISARLDSLFEVEGEKYRIAGKFVTADTSFTKDVKRILDAFKSGESLMPASVKRAIDLADKNLMLLYFSTKLMPGGQHVRRSVVEVIIINSSGILLYDRSVLRFTNVIKHIDKLYKNLEKEI